jgi:RNA polymerase sigma factor (sigma-70 family)
LRPDTSPNLSPPRSPQADILLAERIHIGDPTAEDEFARLFRDKVFVMLLARTHDPEAARELTQDVLLAVLRALRDGRMHEVDRLAAFVHGTARNLANNLLRARSQRPDSEPITPELELIQSADDFDRRERISLVHRALERLDATDQKILLGTLVEDLKPGEIARQIGLTPEAVRQRKSRAVRKVVELIRTWSRKGAG